MERHRRIFISEFDNRGFERISVQLDRLHDLASEGHLTEATPLAPADVVEWLKEIIFTAQETVREIDAHTARLQKFTEDQANRVEQELKE